MNKKDVKITDFKINQYTISNKLRNDLFLNKTYAQLLVKQRMKELMLNKSIDFT